MLILNCNEIIIVQKIQTTDSIIRNMINYPIESRICTGKVQKQNNMW